jgi:hypothetical protein
MELMSLIIVKAFSASLFISFFSFAVAFIVSKIIIRVPVNTSKLRTIGIFIFVVFIGALLDIAKSIFLQVNNHTQTTKINSNIEAGSLMTLVILISLFILSIIILVHQHHYLENTKKEDRAGIDD